MEKRSNIRRANQNEVGKELNCIIQLWRLQRKSLNQSLEDSIYSGERHLEPLCERLMDYISVGHFNVYEKLLSPSKPINQDEAELLRGIYHNIKRSTDQALSFNDKYDNSGDLPLADENSLPNDLYKLNKALAIRFVLEEQLVEVLQV